MSAVGYRTAEPDHPVHYGLPSPWLTVIFSLDDGVEAASDRAALPSATPDPIVAAGLHRRTAYVRSRRDQSGVQLAVHPLACRALFGLPAAELSVTEFDGRQVLGRRFVDAQQELTESPDWSAALGLLGGRLLASLDDHRRLPAVRSELRHAWHLLASSAGRRPVAELAAAVGVSARHLTTLFRREVGCSPKTVAQLIRFERALDAVRAAVGQGRRPDLAVAAAAAGYADQAHLTRDFVERLGVPPSRWISEEFRNLQDQGRRPQADSTP